MLALRRSACISAIAALGLRLGDVDGKIGAAWEQVTKSFLLQTCRWIHLALEIMGSAVQTPLYREVSSKELEAELNSSLQPLVIDCRTVEDYEKAHISGAINIPYYEFKDKYHLAPTSAPIVTVCYGGYYSRAAAQKLAKSGHQDVKTLRGGMGTWLNCGLPTEEGSGSVILDPDTKSTFGAAVEAKKQTSVIYMDNHATTPLDPRVLEEMLPYFKEDFGNAASNTHSYGWNSAKAVRVARQRIADAIGAHPAEIVFTSGATESNNLAIKGTAELYKKKGGHIITCVTEHKAVLDTCKALQAKGFEVSFLPVKQDGLIDLALLEAEIRDTTILVSIMAANNEIGVIQPIEQIVGICRARGVIFHCDATQAIGKVEINVNHLGINLLSVSAHKIYGPKGIGALFVAKNKPGRLVSQIDGGGHEFGMRSGTLNVPGIVGLGKACQIMSTEAERENARIAQLRDRLKSKLLNGLSGIIVNGSVQHRLAGNLHVGISGVDAQFVLMELSGIAISSGSACNSSSKGPSHVVKALGIKDEFLTCTLRFGIGRFNTEREVDFVADAVIREVKRQRMDTNQRGFE